MHPRIDRLLSSAERMLGANSTVIRSVCSGFLLGRFTNEVNDQNQTILAAISGTFDASARDNNILSWAALAAVLLLPSLTKRLARFNRNRQRTLVFTRVLEKYRDTSLQRHSGLAWGSSISLQSAPNIFEGWRHNEIEFDHRSHHFGFDASIQVKYEQFLRESYDRLHLRDDGIKLWLTKNPASFLDSPSVSLSTQLAKYSQCKFKEEILLADKAWRDAEIERAIDGEIRFPHSLCMHAIVATADDKVLFTKRSGKVSYYPGCWSCSIEEQIKPEDVIDGESVILSWARRMLDEELGIQSEEVNADNVRVMSVFLESDVMNVSLCVHVSLDIASAELDSRLRLLPRKDNEFSLWQFMDYDDLIDELRSPTNRHHGSTGYRIVFALIKRYGDANTIDNILRRRGFAQ